MTTSQDKLAQEAQRERFDRYWLARQRARGFGDRLTDAEMLAYPDRRDDEFHAWCAALSQGKRQAEPVAPQIPPNVDDNGSCLSSVALSTLTDADYNEAMARVLASEQRGSPAVQLSVALLRRIIAAASAPALQAGQGEPKDWAKIEAFIDEYVSDYEMLGEAEDGRDACYTPNDNDRALLRDCIAGLLAEPEFLAMLAAPLPVAPKAEPFAWGIETHGTPGVALKKDELGTLADRYAFPLYRATPHADSPVAPKAEPGALSIDRFNTFARQHIKDYGHGPHPLDAWVAAEKQADSAQPVDTEQAAKLARVQAHFGLTEAQARSIVEGAHGPSAQPVADKSALTDEQIIAAARTAKAAHWNLTDAGCVLIGRAVLAAMGTPQQAEQGRPMTFEERLRDLEEEDQMFEDRDMGDS